MPVFARNVVATSQPLAAQAGLTMLLKGGNAVDAALAAAIALTVVEPTSNGIGSDAFALVWDGQDLLGLNGSGRSPRAWSRERFAGYSKMPQLGWDTVTVPGAVDLWSTLSDSLGKLPFGDLFEPALRYAAKGFVVAPVTAGKWSDAPVLYRDFPSFAAHFLPGGRPPGPGELFRSPDLNHTLELLAESHGKSLYEGELAERIVSFSRDTGGCISPEDLSDHAAQWVEPLSQSWNGVELYELPPNGQGLAVLIALGILKRLAIERFPVDSPESLHLQIEAMKRAFGVTLKTVADPAWMTVKPSHFLDDDFLDAAAGAILPDRTAPAAPVPHDGGTVYLTAADEQGMMVSYIQSNYKGFGSGIVIPGTGIALQNRGAGFTLEEGHPNRVEGGKRPYHTIIPGFVMRDGAPLMSFGVMGAHMQAQGHLQMMVRIFAYGQNPQAAADAPRWHVGEDGRLSLEQGFGEGVRTGLAKRGHLLTGDKPASLFGGAQIIHRMADGYCAASDPRKDGQAVGF
jgi:gamma-glutamyltranspeptidase/glutathione hydrolase